MHVQRDGNGDAENAMDAERAINAALIRRGARKRHGWREWCGGRDRGEICEEYGQSGGAGVGSMSSARSLGSVVCGGIAESGEREKRV